MALPVIPLLAFLFSAVGVGALVWYFSLSRQDRDEMNRRAAELARSRFRKGLEKLDVEEAKRLFYELKEKSKGR